MSRKKNRNKNKIKIGNSKKVIQMSGNSKKITMGFYVGDHHPLYKNGEISRYIDNENITKICTIASPPIFELGFVIDANRKRYIYSINENGKKSVKLEVFEVPVEDFNDLEIYYLKAMNVSLKLIDTMIGKIYVLVSDKKIDVAVNISDESEHDHRIEIIKKYKNLT